MTEVTFPARGMRKGSVQKTALRARLRRLVLTAIESSMGSSGGMTLVIIIVQFKNSLKRLRSGSCTAEHLTRLDSLANSALNRLFSFQSLARVNRCTRNGCMKGSKQ